MGKNIWLDGMMGLVVGDALGVPVEFMSREKIKNRESGPVAGMEEYGTYNLPAGTWSDDSSMALATLASIIDRNGIDADDIMVRFGKWTYEGEYTPEGKVFDEGITCRTAIDNYRKHKDANTCGIRGEYANGNGALMRILPACLYYYEQEKEGKMSILEIVAGLDRVSGLTHHHERSMMCCGFYYFMAKRLIEGTDGSSMNTLLQQGIDDTVKYYEAQAENLAEMVHLDRIRDVEAFKKLPESVIKSSGYVIDSIEAAIWCLANTDSYSESMLAAVNLGHDTDTVAAIAGGLAGLYYGYDAIPADWLKVIKKREWIEEMCENALTHSVNAKKE